MNENNMNSDLFKKLVDQIKEQNDRIARLEKLVSENFAVSQKKSPDYFKQEVPEPQVKREWQPVQSKPFDWRWAELALGKYGIQVLGVLIFLIGVGFLLKYSIENGLLTPAFRVAVGLVAATGLLAAAELWRQKFKGWANGLTAGGIVVYYFSFYAAHNFYQLISLHTALASFVAITVLAGAIALARDSLLIGTFSLLGGYLTPLFLSMAGTSATMLAVYVSILAASFLVIAYCKEWLALPTISLLFLIFYYGKSLWFALTFYQVFWFLGVVGIVYTLLPYVYALVYKPAQRFFEPQIIVLSGFFLFMAFRHHITLLANQEFSRQLFSDPTHMFVIKFLFICFGTVYLLGYAGLYVRDKANVSLLATLSFLFTYCITRAMHMHFTQYNSLMSVHFFGLLLFIAGLFLAARYLRIYAYILWTYMTIILVSHYADPVGAAHFVFNAINASIAVFTAGFAVAAYSAYRLNDRLHTHEKYVPQLLASAALLTIFYWFNTTVWQSPYHIVGIMSYATLLYMVGIFKVPSLRYFAYTFWAAGLAHFGYTFFEKHLLHAEHAVQLHLLYALCVGTFVVAYYCAHRFAEHFDHAEKRVLLDVLGVVLALLGLSWGRSALILHYAGAYDQAQGVALTIFYGVYALVLITIGLLKQKHLLRYLGLALIVRTLGKLWFIIMAMNNTLYRVVTFMVVGVLFLVISVAYQQLSKRIK